MADLFPGAGWWLLFPMSFGLLCFVLIVLGAKWGADEWLDERRRQLDDDWPGWEG